MMDMTVAASIAETDYVLGHAGSEVRRLEVQGGLFAPGTERILSAAGLGRSMSVLDIGTGAGDVAMIAAALTGPSGSVLGIDREAGVLERARARAMEAGFGHVRYEAAALDALGAFPAFDVVVGRYVLVHQPHQIAFIKQAAGLVRPGGLLVFIEPALPELDSSDAKLDEPWSYPAVALYEETVRHILLAFALAGVRTNVGRGLVGLFHAAGLREPALVQEVPMAGPSSSLVELACLSLRSLLPVLEKHGILTAEQAGIVDLQERMQEAVSESHSQLRAANLVGAWTTVG